MAVSVVAACPTDEMSWRGRVATLNCQPLENYHCLINEFLKLVEVCASGIWIEPGNCPQYNSQADQLDSVACSSINNLPCPSKIYRSNTVYNHQVCTTVPEQDTTTRRDVVNQTQTETSPEQTSGDCESLYRVLIAAALVVTLIVLTLLLWFLWRRRNICANRKKSTEELELLSNGHYSYAEEEKKKKIQARTRDLVESKKVAEMSEIIMKYGAISIIGTWGSGKTSLAEQIFMECNKKKTRKYMPLSSISIDELQSVVDKCKRKKGNGVSSFILFEDCIKEWYEEDHIKSLIPKINDLVSFCRENPQDGVLVITLQHSVWKRFASNLYTCPILIKKNTNPKLLFDISSSGNLFTEEEKSLLLKKHMEMNQVTVGERGNITVDKTKPVDLDDIDKKLLLTCEPKSVGLPALISLLCKNKKMLHSVKQFISDPIAYIKTTLDCLQNSQYDHERSRFVILVYAMLHNGYFCMDAIDKNLLDEIKSLLKVRETTEDLLKRFFDEEIVYLEMNSDQKSFSIHHSFVVRILFILVARNNFNLIIRKCNKDLLLGCIEPKTFLSSVKSFTGISDDFDENLTVRISKECNKELAARFLDLKTEQPDVVKHVMFRNDDFRNEWKSLQQLDSE